ncbi:MULTISPECIES: hypothetical protein [unclassified Mesorhizobium]|uniref:hypothetical protein n=1 Tax=unclassified Mesorhizobium TaxID=325217 RepID=UPI00112650DE|nr:MULTISPECIES: hypothetical protein [unclassified Mesorhizobium]TPK52897.1 hypothetical protein FJ550_14450 [Mesorhizobium sp. B2-5-2]TPL17737.1 hypothetical protein FJ945_26060 [Mesorhizobium sp. B2-4-9]TPL21329.1 hypothetical protein FJ946_21360 [Mesorhizobium sp. B2-4-7]TPL42942.1 hypothetical protein FJ961_09700 [Mesorhizobium sp. B2-4-5]TPM76929.1 hypothetical protein FJ968_04245 [Mesorhizobium sp. B2-1-6]
MLLRKMWKASSRAEAEDYLCEQQHWCAHERTLEAIESSADRALRQLQCNTRPDSDEPDKNVQLWPTHISETDDPALLETRRVLLRSRVYDYGTEIFLRNLARLGSIESTTVDLLGAGNSKRVESPWIHEVLLAQSYFGFNQMLAFSRMQEVMPQQYRELRNEKTTHLGEIAKLFGIEGTNRHLQFRLSKLVRFASVGFLTATPAQKGHDTMIELGPVGRAFFTKVYVPIINHMPIFNKK